MGIPLGGNYVIFSTWVGVLGVLSFGHTGLPAYMLPPRWKNAHNYPVYRKTWSHTMLPVHEGSRMNGSVLPNKYYKTTVYDSIAQQPLQNNGFLAEGPS